MVRSFLDGGGGPASARPGQGGADLLAGTAPGGLRQRIPPAILGAGAVASAILILLAILDIGGLARVWLNSHWALSAVAALAATLAARRDALGRDGRYRSWLAATLGLWAIGQGLWFAFDLVGEPLVREVASLAMAAVVIPVIGWQLDSLARSLPRVTRATVLLDSGLFVIAVLAIVVIAVGPLAEAAAAGGGYGYLAFAMVLFGGAGGAVILAIEGGDREGLPTATSFSALGLTSLGVGTLLWIAALDTGTALTASHPLNALFSIGALLLGGAGVLSPGRLRLDPGARLSRRAQIAAPVASTVGVVVALLLADGLDRPTARMLDVLIVITILIVGLRQMMILLDLDAASEREHEAARQARAAAEETARTAALLAVAEAQFRSLVEQTPAAVFVDRLDRAGVRVAAGLYISPRVESMTGFSPAEILADNELWPRQVHDEDRPEWVAAWNRHCIEGAPFSVAYRFVAKDGRILWLAEDAQIISRTESEAISQGTVIDLTERREIDERLRQAQRMEAVGELAGGVAQDFNNLLTVISGHAEMLRGEIPEDDSRREHAAAIVKAAGRAATLVSELLAFGRRQMVRPQVLDLSATIEGFVPVITRLLPENVRVVTCLAPDLLSVRADPDQVRQIVLNLAINARDAMPAGGSLRIQTGNRPISPLDTIERPGLAAGDYVELILADDGPGMDAATRARAFEPFFTTKVAGRGTGLGLASVYGIVKQCDGYITLDSSIGGGTTVRILLPVTKDPVAAARPPRPT